MYFKKLAYWDTLVATDIQMHGHLHWKTSIGNRQLDLLQQGQDKGVEVLHKGGEIDSLDSNGCWKKYTIQSLLHPVSWISL